MAEPVAQFFRSTHPIRINGARYDNRSLQRNPGVCRMGVCETPASQSQVGWASPTSIALVGSAHPTWLNRGGREVRSPADGLACDPEER